MKPILLIFISLFGLSALAQQTIITEAQSPAKELIISGTKGSTDLSGPTILINEPREGEKIKLSIDNGKGLKAVVKVRFAGNVTDASGIESVKINGNPAMFNSSDGSFSLIVSLPEGKHAIRIEAKDINGNMTDEIRNVEVLKEQTIASDLIKRNLYILSIGVSNFKNSGAHFSDLKYADDDALAIENQFKNMENVLYNQVFTKTLTNTQATRIEIIDALEWLEKSPSQGDIAVLFVSSHGFKEGENSYLMPYDGYADKLRATAIDFYDINQTVAKLSNKHERNCRVLMLLDACHSGQFGVQGEKGANQINIDNAIRTLNKSEFGIMMLHSSESSETSFEDPAWKHGAFTFAILEALQQGKGDVSNDGVIEFDELSLYVKNRVKELTNMKQHPVSKNPATITNFPISIIR